MDGFRLDAAKRKYTFDIAGFLINFSVIARIDIAATDLANIISRLTSKPYITQEVIWGATDAVQPSEYLGIGILTQISLCNLLYLIDCLQAMFKSAHKKKTEDEAENSLIIDVLFIGSDIPQP